MCSVLARGIQLEPWRHEAAAPRLDADDELRVHELLTAIVELQRIDHVALRIVHPRGREDIVESVGIEIADARPPWTVVLGANGVRDFPVLVRAFLHEKRI